MAVDLMQNRIDSSITQLQHACPIFNAWRSRRDNSATSLEIDLIEEHILPIIARFSASWGMHCPITAVSCSEYVREGMHVQNLPQSFMSLNQAHSSLRRILDRIDVSTPTGCPPEVNVTPAAREPIVAMLVHWEHRYQHFTSLLHIRDIPPATQQRLTILELHYTTARLLYEMRSAKNEMLYDTELETFQSIVQQCEIVVRIERDITAISEPKMLVCFHVSIIVPVYLTASRCRDSRNRREALRLLTSFPRRKGIWLSLIKGLVAQQVIDIEEDGMQNPQPCEDVPLSNRIELTRGALQTMSNGGLDRRTLLRTCAATDVDKR